MTMGGWFGRADLPQSIMVGIHAVFGMSTTLVSEERASAYGGGACVTGGKLGWGSLPE